MPTSRALPPSTRHGESTDSRGYFVPPGYAIQEERPSPVSNRERWERASTQPRAPRRVNRFGVPDLGTLNYTHSSRSPTLGVPSDAPYDLKQPLTPVMPQQRNIIGLLVVVTAVVGWVDRAAGLRIRGRYGTAGRIPSCPLSYVSSQVEPVPDAGPLRP